VDRRKKLHQLAGPIFIEILLFMLLGVADVFMLSQYNDAAVGAVGAANQIIGNLNLIFAIISAGTAVLVAQNVGAKNKSEVSRISAVSLIVNLILGVIISSIALIFGRKILVLMGVTPDLIGYASDYFAIVGGAMFFQAVLSIVSAIARSHGYTKQIMYVSVGMNIINIVGDAVLIFGLFGAPALGVRGAAIATTASRAIAAAVGLWYLLKVVLPKKTFGHLKNKPFGALQKLFKIGFPAAMESMSYSLYQTAIMSIVLVNLGNIAHITRTYVWTICWFAMLCSLAIGQASQIQVGQLVGAEEFEEAYNTGLKNFKIGLIFTIIASSSLFLFGRVFMGFYTDDQAIITLGASALAVAAFLEPGRAFNIIFINSLRGAGDVVFPVIMAMIFMWGVGVVSAYLFAVVLGMGLPGIWLGLACDEWIRGICMYMRWRSKKWMPKTRREEASIAS
jgi:putative MATE family efflux protein